MPCLPKISQLQRCEEKVHSEGAPVAFLEALKTLRTPFFVFTNVPVNDQDIAVTM